VSLIAAAPRAPYALEPTNFPFPALATMAGRAPLGGPRELALACLMVGRMVVDATREGGSELLSIDQKESRALGAKHWLGSAAIGASVRAALARLAESSASEDRGSMKAALDTVMTVTANQLDSGARLELGRLVQSIAK